MRHNESVGKITTASMAFLRRDVLLADIATTAYAKTLARRTWPRVTLMVSAVRNGTWNAKASTDTGTTGELARRRDGERDIGGERRRADRGLACRGHPSS